MITTLKRVAKIQSFSFCKKQLSNTLKIFSDLMSIPLTTDITILSIKSTSIVSIKCVLKILEVE